VICDQIDIDNRALAGHHHKLLLINRACESCFSRQAMRANLIIGILDSTVPYVETSGVHDSYPRRSNDVVNFPFPDLLGEKAISTDASLIGPSRTHMMLQLEMSKHNTEIKH
jgi:hypothetical protein